MKGIFFFDVDTQRDLMLADGKLRVPGAERMVAKLRRLFDFARAHSVTVISSVNAHSEESARAAGFPPFCIQGTDGQRKVDDTLLLHPLVLENKPVNRNFAELVRKHQQIIVENQAFDPFSNPATERLMRVLPAHAIVFGVPGELSVKSTVLGLRRLGIKTAVLQNATLALNPKEAAKAEAAMRGVGADLIALEVLLDALGG
jgi:nicotinamidase-related amidase